jgi:hypothetical protein
MFKNHSLLFLCLFFLVIFVFVPQSVFTIDSTGCTTEYCRINANDNLRINQCTGDEWGIENTGSIDIFVPVKDCDIYADCCDEYVEWILHFQPGFPAGVDVVVDPTMCWAIDDGQQVEGCDGVCQACMNDECGIADEGTDPGGHCAQGTTASDGCRLDFCSGTDASCGYQTSGDGGCPVCGTCSGAISIACVPHTWGTFDIGCSKSTCRGCSGSEIGTCTGPVTISCGGGVHTDVIKLKVYW